MIPYVYFISDLHLDAKTPQTAEAFIRFLRAQVHHAEALYILGDFFEVWIGDDAADLLEKKIIHELSLATEAGLPIYFIHGNRDFLLGKRFVKESGVKILKDPSLIQIFGKKWMISHGDYLCTDDHAHMRLRKFTLNPFIQFIFLRFPIFFRRKIGEALRSKSHAHKKGQNMKIMDININKLRAELNQYQATRIIHGHTHEGKIHEFKLDDALAQRVVLGDWHQTAKVLRCTADGEFQLETLTLKPAL